MPIANQLTSTVQKKKILESEFGSGNPAIHYIGISLTAPSVDGTNITEPLSTNGYARIVVANNSTNWTTYTGGKITNKVSFAFPVVINANWNDLSQPMYIFIADHATNTGTAFKYSWELTGIDKKLLQVGATPRIEANTANITM